MAFTDTSVIPFRGYSECTFNGQCATRVWPSDLIRWRSRCKGKPAVELTKFVRIDMNTGEVELPKGCVERSLPEFLLSLNPEVHHSHPVPRGKLWSQVKRYSDQ